MQLSKPEIIRNNLGNLDQSVVFVDSHCHLDRLDLAAYDGDLTTALQAAVAMDVRHFLCPSIDFDNFPKILEIAHQHRNVTVSVGLHPTENINYITTVDEICHLANNSLVVGIGETGLDYYHTTDNNERLAQQQRFTTHILAAKELHKPLIIHSRDASSDTLRILRENQAESIGGVFHCFTGDWETASQAINLNFYIAFSGIITFKNAENLRQVAHQVPLSRILLETDAPFLAPSPYRGKTNEPSYLPFIAQTMANLHEISYQELASITTKNFFTLFRSCL